MFYKRTKLRFYWLLVFPYNKLFRIDTTFVQNIYSGNNSTVIQIEVFNNNFFFLILSLQSLSLNKCLVSVNEIDDLLEGRSCWVNNITNSLGKLKHIFIVY